MLDLKTLTPGTVIEVDVDHPDFAFVWFYINKRKHLGGWKAVIATLNQTFDPAKFDPLYYCHFHKRLEDGTHRLQIAKMRGMNTVPMKVYARCHHGAPNVLDLLTRLVKENRGGHPKDSAWLAACHEKKWRLLNTAVDYRGAVVLDVGSHCGYAALASIWAGAKSALGIDVRADMIALANRAAVKLCLSGSASFRQADWLTAGPVPAQYDIVQCLGLPHYFPADKFPGALVRLAGASRRLLILELRMDPGENKALTRAGKQTLPTRSWLSGFLADAGFTVEQIFPITGNTRELWIAKRKPEK